VKAMYSQMYWGHYSRGRHYSHYSSEPVLMPHPHAADTSTSSCRLDEMLMFPYNGKMGNGINGNHSPNDKLPPILAWNDFRNGQLGFPHPPPQSQVYILIKFLIFYLFKPRMTQVENVATSKCEFTGKCCEIRKGKY
jgi:hypothetical protein